MPLKYIRDTINWNMAHLPIAKKKKKILQDRNYHKDHRSGCCHWSWSNILLSFILKIQWPLFSVRCRKTYIGTRIYLVLVRLTHPPQWSTYEDYGPITANSKYSCQGSDKKRANLFTSHMCPSLPLITKYTCLSHINQISLIIWNNPSGWSKDWIKSWKSKIGVFMDLAAGIL